MSSLGLAQAVEDREQAGRAIGGVVEAVPVFGVEDVAGQFARQQSAFFPQAGFGDGVARPAHFGSAAPGADVVEQALRAFDVGQDQRAGVAGQQIAAVDGQKLVAVKQASAAIHHADAVAVAVQAHAQVGAALAHGFGQGGHVLGPGGIGGVVGKAAVGLAKQGNDLRPHAPQHFDAYRARRAVASVHHHAAGGAGAQTGDNFLHIFRGYVHVGQQGASGGRPVRPALVRLLARHEAVQLPNAVVVQGRVAQPYLESVVFRRIVAGRDHDPGLSAQVQRGVIQAGGGDHARPQHVHSRGGQSPCQGVGQSGGGQTAVPPHHGRTAAFGQEAAAAGPAQSADPDFVKVLSGFAAYVVSPEDGRRSVHAVFPWGEGKAACGGGIRTG